MTELAGILGIAMRAGKLRCGFSAVKNATEQGNTLLIILACDAGQSTARRVTALAAEHGCTLVTMYDRRYLGRALGRDAQAVVATVDEGFAQALSAALQKASAAQPDGTKGDRSEW